MHASINIGFFIDSLDPGTIFSTQSIIHLAERGPLDSYLSRCYKSGILRRLAWGLYQYAPTGDEAYPTPMQIMEEKARAFNKKLMQHGSTIAKLLQFKIDKPKKINSSDNEFYQATAPDHEITHFYTNGASSRFQIFRSDGNTQQVYVHQLSPKKQRSYTAPGGQWISAVRFIGKTALDKRSPEELPNLPIAVEEKEEIRNQQALMPSWLQKMLAIEPVDDYKQRTYDLIDIPPRKPLASENQISFLYGRIKKHRIFPFNLMQISPTPS